MHKLLLQILVVAVVVFISITIIVRTANAYDWSNMVYKCEARGVVNPWYANTGNGFFFGPQFTRGTWHSSGGGLVREMGDRNGKPMKSYTMSYIIRIAENTMRRQGRNAWPKCNRYL